MKQRDLKDLALAINYIVLEPSGCEFEESMNFSYKDEKYVTDYIKKEREKIARRVSEENKELLTIGSVSNMVKFLEGKSK